MRFETTTDLMRHQKDAAMKLAPSRVGALFADMGTGKSRIVIELAAARRARIDRVVWFCPVALKPTIVREIFKHTDASAEDVYVFDDDTTDGDLPMDCQWYVVGIESMSSSARVVFAVRRLMEERVYVVVDESTMIKNDRAKRSQRLIHMSRVARYRSILTGTPITQGIADLYGQMTFLSPEILGYRSWHSFAANHLVLDRYTGRVIRSHDHEYLARRMAPYVYQVLKDECLDLPEKVHDSICIEMKNEQRWLYEQAKDWVWDKHKNDGDDAGRALLHLFTILQSISQGIWRRPTGDGGIETIEVDTNRPDALLGIVSNAAVGEHVVVWSNLHHGVRKATEALVDRYGEGSVHQFHGGIRPTDREANLDRWRRKGGFLVATQQSGGRGLTLVESAFTVFYGNGFKYDDRAQAEDRTHRIGQTRKSLYVDIILNRSIEERVHRALAERADGLASFRRRIDEVRHLGMGEDVRNFIADL